MTEADEDGPPFPYAAWVAGSLWAALGLLVIAVTGGAVGVAVLGRYSWPTVCMTAVGGLYFGGTLFVIGRRVRRHALRDPLPAGIASVVIAVFFYSMAGLSLLTEPPPIALPGGVVSLTFAAGSVLLTAGVLAVWGRRDHLAWKDYRDSAARAKWFDD